MNAQRSSVAIDWFMRLCEEDVNESELSEWAQWCADPDNLREFQAIRTTWRGFDRLGPAAAELLETALVADPTKSFVREETAKPATVAVQAPRQWQRYWPPALAAAVVLGIAAAFLYTHPLTWAQRGEISAQAELMSTTLPDGSTLTLAPRTDIDVDFSGLRRHLAFMQGEAYFKVRADKEKPFVVKTGGLEVTAIGTAFDVRTDAHQVTVTVREGAVEVARTQPGSDAMRWRLAVGQRLIFDAHRGAADIQTIDLVRTAAWHEGRLEYFAAPLAEVIADINRYSGRSIEIGDPQLASLAYTGSVFTQSVDDWLGAIEATFPVRVVIARDEHIVLLTR